MVTTIPRGSTTERRVTTSGLPTGVVAGTPRQKARFQTLAMAYRVSRLVTTPPTTSTYASTPPYWTPASSRPILPTKPENGGMPARFIAGTKNSTPSTGDRAARPPSSFSDVLPPRRSISPVTRNSVVWMVMWWAV